MKNTQTTNPNPQILNPKFLILSAFVLFSSLSFGQSISRTQIISNAVPYATYTFTATSANIKHGVSCSGVGTINTPSWVVVGYNTSMPYCWGGFSTLASFTNKLTQGKSAGDNTTSNGGDGSEICAVGVDCSGFVSRTWGRTSKESTSSLPNISTSISASSVQPGDIFNRAGSHVRLAETNYGNGNYRCIESAGNGWHVAYHSYTASQLSGYVPRKYIHVTNTPPPSSCGTPSALTASSITLNSAILNWSVISGATSYNVQYKLTSSSTWTTVSSTTASKAISGLTSSTSYQFQVQAVCSSTGTYSSAASFTTSATASSSSIITLGNGTSAYSAHPFGTVYMDERVQYIMTRSELAAAGWSSSLPYLKSLAFNVTSAASQPMGSFTINISHISATTFSTTSFLSGSNSTTVYSGTVAAVSGWNTYHFTTPFVYNGSDNLLISICWNNSSFTANSVVQSFSYSNFVALYYRADLSGSGVCGQSTGTQSYYRPNSKLEFSNAPSIAPFENGGLKNLETPISEGTTKDVSFEVFPNPFDGNRLNGKFSDEGDKQMAVGIYDMLGREVFAKEIFVEAGSFSLSLSGYNLQPGMYVFMGLTSDSRYTKTLIVK